MGRIGLFSIVLMTFSVSVFLGCGDSSSGAENHSMKIKLPAPKLKGTVSVEETIKKRRSRRSFEARPLTKEQLSQILWSAQGVTGKDGRKRASPSAGATYPLDLYVVIGKKTCVDITAGVYRYLPHEHSIEQHAEGQQRKPLAAAALGQNFVAQAPVVVVVAADYSKTTGRYGKRGIRYVHMEAGHVGENVHLQAEALGLGTCMVGAFDDSKVSEVLKLPSKHEPLYIMPVGHPR